MIIIILWIIALVGFTGAFLYNRAAVNSLIKAHQSLFEWMRLQEEINVVIGAELRDRALQRKIDQQKNASQS